MMDALINERHKSEARLTALRKEARETREVEELERETVREAARKVTCKVADPAVKNAEELDAAQILIQLSQGGRA
jgi:hypothetical protein